MHRRAAVLRAVEQVLSGYQLALDPQEVDAVRFTRLVTTAAEHTQRECGAES